MVSPLHRSVRRFLRIFAVVAVLILLINEGRFVLWGPFGYPERPAMPNFGEVRRQLDVRLGSEEEFVALLREHPREVFLTDGRGRLRLDDYRSVSQGRDIADAPVDWDRVRIATRARWNGSLLFSQQIFSLSYTPIQCAGMNLEISQSGALSNWGSCGQ